MRKAWYVYVLRCGDGTLYTGVTNDLARRLEAHSSGRGAKYTRGRGRATLRHWEAFASRGRALSREAAIKKLPREKKLALSVAPGIRPATPADVPFIRRTIERFGLDPERIGPEQFVIAMEGRVRAGFARIKPYRACFELGSVAVLPKFRHRGVGSALVRCLVARFPSRRVWITTDKPEYFARFGFRAADPPAELRRKIERICHGACRRVTAMARARGS